MPVPILRNLLNKKPPHDYYVLDVGTSLIKAGSFRIIRQETSTGTWEESLEVLALTQQPLGQTTFRGKEVHELDALIEACSLALEKSNLKTGSTPQTIHLVTGGAIKNLTNQVRLQRTEPERQIDSKELTSIFQKIEQATSEKLLHQAASSWDVEPKKITRLSSEATSFRLDGQRLSSPINFSGKELYVTLEERFALHRQLKALRQIGETLGIKIQSISSSTLKSVALLRQEFPHGILVDTGGKLSEVAIYDENHTRENQFFCWGGYHLTWMIKRRLGISFEQAERIKHAASNQSLDADKQKAIDKITGEWNQVLLTGIEKCLETFSSSRPLPENFILTGGAAATNGLKSAFIAYPWTKNLPFNTFPQPHIPRLSQIEEHLTTINIPSPALVPLWGFVYQQMEKTTND